MLIIRQAILGRHSCSIYKLLFHLQPFRSYNAKQEGGKFQKLEFLNNYKGVLGEEKKHFPYFFRGFPLINLKK